MLNRAKLDTHYVMNNRLKKLVVGLTFVTAVVLSACNNEDLTLNSTFVKSLTYAEYVPDAAITLSTFRLDSVQTSGYNTVWIGRHKKPIIGDVCSKSILKLSEPTYNWVAKEKYDSVTIVLRHNGSYQGDTTRAITVNISPLTQPLRFAEDESAFYNVRTFSVSDKVIGSYRFRPRPNQHPRLRFRLSDEFGQSLVNFIKNNQNLESGLRTTNFEKFLGGIQISSNEDAENLIAFRADSVKIQLHSHLTTSIEEGRQTRTLTLTESEKQYNVVWNENIESPYETLTDHYNQVSETEGGLHSVMFEGLGYYTRINIPELENIMSINEYAHIVKAELVLYPERDSYDKHNFPSTFYLSVVGKNNVVESTVVTSSATRVAAVLHNNELDENDVYYTADITYYVNAALANGEIDKYEGLQLTWNTAMYSTDYNFMVFNGSGKEKYYSYLKLYYYYYDKQDR